MEKENKKQKKRKIHIFFLFIIISAILWTVSKLSEEYTHTVKLKVNYINFFNNKTLQNEVEEYLLFNFKTSGFNLISLNNSNKLVNIDLRNLKKKKDLYYYLTNDNIFNIQSQFSSEEKILKISPDTLFFDFGKLSSKRIEVKPKISIAYKAGYALVGDLSILPKTISIKGTEDQISKIDKIYTEVFELKNVANNFEYTVNLDIPKEYENIHFSKKHIFIKGVVKKFTENSFYVPFKVINVPEKFKIKTFKDKLKITYKVSLDNFDRIKASDFNIICDFNKIDTLQSSFLIPEIIKQPDLISNVKMSPNKVEFLIVE